MIIRGDRQSLEGKTAWILAENIQDMLSRQRQAVLAVPGGRSVGGIFRLLARENVDWERVHIFMVDERLVPPGHPDSNFRVVEENLQEIIAFPSMHPFIFTPAQEKAGVEAYRRELADLGGRFDIVLVGCGEDGHIASIFPGRHEPEPDTEDFFLVRDAPKPPAARMTASIGLLLRAQVGVGLFFGAEKRDALCRLFDETVSVRDCPAKILRLLPQHYIITDQEGCP